MVFWFGLLSIPLALSSLAAGVAAGLVVYNQVPGAIPKKDHALFRTTYSIFYDEFGIVSRGGFPPGIHRYDTRIYAAFFAILRDVYLADGVVLTRAEREVVATAVSVSNRCYFCVHNHSRLVQISSSEPGVDELILNHRAEEIRDPRERDLARYGLMSRHPHDAIIWQPPFTAAETSDAAIVAFSFHYVNRIMDALGPREGLQREILAKPPPQVLGHFLGLKRPMPPGTALKRLLSAGHTRPCEISLEDEATVLRITRNRKEVSDAMLFAWSNVQATAQELFDAEVLSTIRSYLSGWDGLGTSMGMEWADEAVAELAHSPRNQALARQGIIVAREAFRVSRNELTAACERDQRRQLALVSYSAFAAALRICEWLVIPEG